MATMQSMLMLFGSYIYIYAHVHIFQNGIGVRSGQEPMLLFLGSAVFLPPLGPRHSKLALDVL